MADNDRTFSEGEAYALVADGVKRETAELTASVAAKDSKITELSNSLDVVTTEKAAAIERADKADKDLADYKAEVESEKAREALRTTRLAQVAEASPALDVSDATEAGKARAERIVAMADDVFEGYLADLKAVTPAQTAAKDDKASKAPRQSAGFSGAAGSTDEAPRASVMGVLAARRGLSTKSA